MSKEYTQKVRDLIFDTNIKGDDITTLIVLLSLTTIALVITIITNNYLKQKEKKENEMQVPMKERKKSFVWHIFTVSLGLFIVIGATTAITGYTVVKNNQMRKKYVSEENLIIATGLVKDETFIMTKEESEKIVGEKYGVQVYKGDVEIVKEKILMHDGRFAVLNKEGKVDWYIHGDLISYGVKDDDLFPEERVFQINISELAEKYKENEKKLKSIYKVDSVSEKAILMISINDLIKIQQQK